MRRHVSNRAARFSPHDARLSGVRARPAAAIRRLPSGSHRFVLDRPSANVPHSIDEDQLTKWGLWLRAQGVLPVLCTVGGQRPDAFYVAFGVSPRGTRHAVVMRNGALVHDPNPKGGGIKAVEEAWLLIPAPAMPEGLVHWMAR